MVGPAIAAIQKQFPHAQIDLLVHRNTQDLFRNFPDICSVNTISNKRAKWKGWLPFSKYDLAVVFNAFEELLPLVKYARRVSNFVLAYETSDKSVNLKLDIALPKSHERQHIMRPYLELIGAYGVEQNGMRVLYYPTSSELQSAKKIIHDNGFEKSFLIGYKVFSLPSRPWRDWSISRFYELSQLILDIKPDAKFLLFGSSVEAEKLTELHSRIGQQYSALIIDLPLRMVGALMAQLNLYVGVDTGLTHLMSSFDIPIEILYHGKNPSSIAKPIGHPCCKVLDHPMGEASKEHDSLDDIPAELVYRDIVNYLHKN